MYRRTVALTLAAALSAISFAAPAMASESIKAPTTYNSVNPADTIAEVQTNAKAAEAEMFKTRDGKVVLSEDDKARIEAAMATPEWAEQAAGVTIAFTEVPVSEVIAPANAEGNFSTAAIVKKRWYGFEVWLSRSETKTLSDSYKQCAASLTPILAGVGTLIGGPAGAAVGGAIGAVGCSTIWVASRHAVNTNRCLKFKVAVTPAGTAATYHPGTCVQD